MHNSILSSLRAELRRSLATDEPAYSPPSGVH
jgi:hypothetical protein